MSGDWSSDVCSSDLSAAVWQIYQRLSKGHTLLPIALAFSFDREMRAVADIEDLKARSGGLVRFLPRRAYENYLIEPDAIVAVMNAELAGASIDILRVLEWLSANARSYCSKDAPFAEDSTDWKRTGDAAKLLKRLFSDLSETKLEYRKTTHSVMLTEWLLGNGRQRLLEIVDYVDSFVPTGADDGLAAIRS